MPGLEAQIERDLIKHAKKVDVLTYKFVSPGESGVPDRLFIGPTGKIGFLEIKAPGKIPSGLQLDRIETLKTRGSAGWTDNVVDGVKFINSLL